LARPRAPASAAQPPLSSGSKSSETQSREAVCSMPAAAAAARAAPGVAQELVRLLELDGRDCSCCGELRRPPRLARQRAQKDALCDSGIESCRRAERGGGMGWAGCGEQVPRCAACSGMGRRG